MKITIITCSTDSNTVTSIEPFTGVYNGGAAYCAVIGPHDDDVSNETLVLWIAGRDKRLKWNGKVYCYSDTIDAAMNAARECWRKFHG